MTTQLLTVDQADALRRLDEALALATDTGLLDALQPHCSSPDSISDVCDAVGHRRAALEDEDRMERMVARIEAFGC